jgi:hypothetical protein
LQPVGQASSHSLQSPPTFQFVPPAVANIQAEGFALSVSENGVSTQNTDLYWKGELRQSGSVTACLSAFRSHSVVTHSTDEERVEKMNDLHDLGSVFSVPSNRKAATEAEQSVGPFPFEESTNFHTNP